ncbi:hypothetical protein EWM64_g10040 [Hericium alpestre]|uniref:AB hydrolase-1 domain-containing protein n=1 Tax=Hericium alpestre TaxID=135208 RepID=A0A4Y9ZJD9_9AGAM|nr:hypothetical protein EWM64_g10040 [Hericium alpestre]
MTTSNFVKEGVFSYCDTGPPASTHQYTTIFILHGFAWHAGSFQRLAAYADQAKARLILMNRQDYPAAELLGEEDLSLLSPADPRDMAAALASLRTFMKRQGNRLIDFVELIIDKEKLPPPDGEYGGVIISGWSFAGNWINALLANVNTAHPGHSKLRRHLRRVIIYDLVYIFLGYAPPAGAYNPLQDDSLDPEKKTLTFAAWVSGYYNHGESVTELEFKAPLASPAPTILTMSEEDRQSVLHPMPGDAGGSDMKLFENGIRCGLYRTLKEDALYLKDGASEATGGPTTDDSWRDIEVLYLWCDRSVWELPFGVRMFKKELAKAKEGGKAMRNIKFSRMRGSNHFAHWDEPEKLLRKFLAPADDLE